MAGTLYFGTDGIRGKADSFPFTPEALYTLGRAIAQWSVETYNTKSPRMPIRVSTRVLVGHDTRISCQAIKKSLEEGLCQQPLAISDAGELPTPAVLHLIQTHAYNFGIVISASHNPYTDNGIKLFDAKRGKLSPEDEARIVELFYELEKKPSNRQPLGHVTPWPNAGALYVEHVLNQFPKTLGSSDSPKRSIVLDCAHGATYCTAQTIFAKLAGNMPLHLYGVNPDGKNINNECGSLHPEHLQEIVASTGASLGFAFDGDGDRVIAVNAFGEVKDGDDLLALLLQHPDFKEVKTVVGTIMTNHGFEQYLKNIGKTLIRTPVGDKYVAAALKKHNLLLGGEASGHIIIRTYLETGDGTFIAAKVLESIILTNNWNMTTFTKTPQVLINVPVTHKKPLDQPPYATIINDHQKQLINGRLVVRYSGTEHVLRVMVEDQTGTSANTIAHSLSQKLQKALANQKENL